MLSGADRRTRKAYAVTADLSADYAALLRDIDALSGALASWRAKIVSRFAATLTFTDIQELCLRHQGVIEGSRSAPISRSE